MCFLSPSALTVPLVCASNAAQKWKGVKGWERADKKLDCRPKGQDAAGSIPSAAARRCR
jgi:hypothetical protein